MRIIGLAFLKSRAFFAYSMLFVSFVVFGIYHPVQKHGLDSGFEPVEFALGSMFFCSLFLLPFCYRKISAHRFRRSDFYEFLVLGFLATFLGLVFKLYGLSLTSANNVAMINALSGVFLTLLGVVVLGEEFDWKFISVIVVMSFGLFIFKSGSLSLASFGIGDALTLAYVFVVALSTILAKKYMGKHPARIVAFMRIFFGLPFLFVFYLVFFGRDFSVLLSYWAMVAGFVFAVRVLTYYKAVSMIKMRGLALFTIVSPVVTFAYSYLFFGETLSEVQILGSLIVFFGLYMSYRFRTPNIK